VSGARGASARWRVAPGSSALFGAGLVAVTEVADRSLGPILTGDDAGFVVLRLGMAITSG